MDASRSSRRTAKDTLNISNLNTDRDPDGNKRGGNRGGDGGGKNKVKLGGGQGNGGRDRGNNSPKRGGVGNRRRRDGNDSDFPIFPSATTPPKNIISSLTLRRHN